MAATLGLPKHVSNFLRHMEIHRECLKWNITETSHKITLTLTWNFRKTNKGKDSSLWDRLQRTLKMSRSMDEDTVPRNVSAFVSTSPQHEQRAPLQRNLTWTGPFHNRQLTFSRSLSTGSAFTPPVRVPPMRAPLKRQQHLQHPPLCRSSSISPSRFSWPSESLSVDTPPQHNSTPAANSGRGSLIRSQSATSPPSQNRTKLSYRTEEDVTHSLEDLLEKEYRKKQDDYQTSRRNWNKQVRECPRIFCADRAEGSQLHNNSFISDITTATESEASLEVNQTVQKCIQSCDKILYRHSTVIT